MRLFQAITAASLGCVLSSASALDIPIPALPDVPHIVITGEGAIEAAADYAELTVTVTIGDAESVKAKEDVEAQLVAVADALIAYGLDEEQMKVGATSIDVKYDWHQRPPALLGTQASRSIVLTPLQINQLDDVIRIATEAGATNIGRPTLRSTREAELSAEVQMRAAADARARAERLANQFGRSLGAVWGIATEEARSWHWYGGGGWGGGGGGGGAGGLFGDPGGGSRALTFTPIPVTHYSSVYVVYLLGPPLDSIDE